MISLLTSRSVPPETAIAAADDGAIPMKLQFVSVAAPESLRLAPYFPARRKLSDPR